MTKSAGKFEKIAFVASEVPQALDARERLIKKYGNADPAQADVIVALGGDGLMLQTLRTHLKPGINTLDFYVENGVFAGTNPSGLRYEFIHAAAQPLDP